MLDGLKCGGQFHTSKSCPVSHSAFHWLLGIHVGGKPFYNDLNLESDPIPLLYIEARSILLHHFNFPFSGKQLLCKLREEWHFGREVWWTGFLRTCSVS